MVDLSKEIDYERTDYALEEFMLFCIMVPGKKATTTVKILDSILTKMHEDVDKDRNLLPFDLIRTWFRDNPNIHFETFLKFRGVGCHSHRAKAIRSLVASNIDLRSCSISDLEALYGVGQKTSRFFLMCTRPNVKAAILDRHILRYLAKRGFNVPDNTPTSKPEYLRIERIFLQEAERNNVDPMQFDFGIWKKAAGVD